MSNSFSDACDEFALKSLLLASGEAPESEIQPYQHHLQNCARCREELNAALAVQNQYAGLPLYDAPDELIHQLLTKARVKKTWRSRLSVVGLWRHVPSRPGYARPGPVVFAAVLAAALLALFYMLAFRSDSSLAWEAPAFEDSTTKLWSSLASYELDQYAEKWVYGWEGRNEIEIYPWELRASHLRNRIDMMMNELERIEDQPLKK